MRRVGIFVLDDEALVRRPDLCFRQSPPPDLIQVVVPDLALRFVGLQLAPMRVALLTALEQGSVRVVALQLEPDLKVEREANLSSIQLAVAQLAATFAEEATRAGAGEEVHVVTASPALIQHCQDRGLKTITPEAAAGQLPWRKFNILSWMWTSLRTWLGHEGSRQLRGIVFTALVLPAVLLVAYDRTVIWVFLGAHPAVAVAACLAGALWAFWVRSRYRFQYALVEIVVGVVLVWIAMFYNPSDHLDQEALLKAAGGIYVIVRGLDNLGKALMGSRAGLLWWRVFGD